MQYDTFMDLVRVRMDSCYEVLVAKGRVYAKGAEDDSSIDRLGSFKRQAAIDGGSPEEALRGQMSKHYTALMDFIKDPLSVPFSEWEEKIGDIHNFLYLLEGLVVERYESLG